jgi:hypothetical protein
LTVAVLSCLRRSVATKARVRARIIEFGFRDTKIWYFALFSLDTFRSPVSNITYTITIVHATYLHYYRRPSYIPKILTSETLHNVAHNITKGSKYKIHLSKINRRNLILYFIACFGPILGHFKYCSLRNNTIIQRTFQLTNYTAFFRSFVHINSRFPPTWAVSKPKVCKIFYINIYYYNIYQHSCINLHIVLFIFASILRY